MRWKNRFGGLDESRDRYGVERSDPVSVVACLIGVARAAVLEVAHADVVQKLQTISSCSAGVKNRARVSESPHRSRWHLVQALPDMYLADRDLVWNEDH